MQRRWKLLFLLATLLLALLLLHGCGREQADGTAGIASAEETANEEDGVTAKPSFASPEDLAGKPVGIRTGTSFDQDLKTYIPTAQAVYYNTESDLIAALQSGKIDAFLNDEPIARALCAQAGGVTYLPQPLKEEAYAFALPQGREDLRDQINEALAQLREEGVMDALEEKWFSGDESLQTPTEIPASGPNGVLRVATNSGSPPFGIIKDGQLAGFDIDVLIAIAERLGYGLELSDMEFVAILPALAAGKADIAASCITVTEERAKSVLFTDPDYVGGVVVVVRNDHAAAKIGFWAGLRDSFVSTFVVENRWQLIVRGLGVTLLISLMTALFGTAMGFVVSFGLRSRYRLARLPAKTLVSVFQGTPLLVILLILNFVVFKKLDASIAVAVIGFSLDFAVTVGGLLNTGIGAVDNGELEAAAALGFSRRQIFLRITLPQVVRRMLPSYQGSFISMVKMTSIVGYIAIQDLTKVSDIIRSRTFQAFFPLIATAIIYFVLAHLLSAVMGAAQLRLNPEHRSRTIKGVEIHD